MKKIIKEHGPAVLVFVLILFIIVFLLFYIPFFYLHWEFVSETIKPNPINEYTLVYYCGALLSAFVVAFIAYYQLRKINRNLCAEYLVKIDERWRSAEIIKARVIIHDLYLKSNNWLKEKGCPFEKKDLHNKIGNEIIKMSESIDNVKSFISLLNFLDFMETIGYLLSENHLSIENLNELFGASLEFNYEIFEPYINHRRHKHNIKDFYKEFQDLYEAIQESNDKKKK